MALTSRSESRPPRALALALFGTALAYLVCGLAALKLAIPPGYASPMFPSAGIALACAVVFGWPAAAGAGLGSFLVNASLAPGFGFTPLALGVPLLVGFGATLQALFGAALVRRFVRQPLTLSEPRDIALFLALGAVLACVVNPTISTAALGAARVLPPENLPVTWVTWWFGDTMGALIGAPITLTLIGQPRNDWQPRRYTVGVTLFIVSALMAGMIVLVARWDVERLRANFDREAAIASSTLSFQMVEPLHALESLRGLYSSADVVTPLEMRRVIRPWLEGPGHPQAMAMLERVRPENVEAFQAAVRAEGVADFHVFDRRDLPGYGPLPGRDLYVVRSLQPPRVNTRALGLNAMSVPVMRRAIQQAIDTDRAVASEAFPLALAEPGTDATGIVIVHAIYDGAPMSAAQRRASVRGVVAVTLLMNETLRNVRAQLPRYLHLCLTDTDPEAKGAVLSGNESCDARTSPLRMERPVDFAGRRWQLRIEAHPAEVPGSGGSNAWLFALVGLSSASMLGALLLLVTGRAQRIERAVFDRTAALTQEVRERQQVVAALRDSEQRFRNIFNNVPIGIYYTDLEGNLKQANPRFCELVGWSSSELLTKNAADFVPPEDVAQDGLALSQLLSGAIPVYRRQKRMLDSGKRVLWVLSIVSLLRDEDGEPRRIVGTVEDITEHLRLADAERAREAAEAANRAKSEFLSRMSHELRTPLNAMLGFAQLLELDQRHPIATTHRPWVTQIQHAGWHLLEMINDVLDLSRIESGTLRLKTDVLDLEGMLGSTLALVEADARKRDIVITQALHPDALCALGDGTRVKQILTNLLSNAVKYNIDRGRIHIESRMAGEMVELSVNDTGLGMTASQVGDLFQPFNRLGRERTQLEGTGIGLVISQRLAELMGGHLRAHSTAGAGSAFILSLPAIGEPDTVRSDLGPMEPGPTDYHERIVHYVEDNETNVEVMRGVLAQRPQIRMDVSTTGLDGLVNIRTSVPDVVLLDMHLPDISGLELLRHLKQDAATAGIPVIAVSADALAAQVDTALEAGAAGYLTKPVNITELLGALDRLLGNVDTQH